MPGKTAPSRLKVRLLGGLMVEDGDRELAPEDFGGVKPRQLFEILLTAKGPLSKLRIADLLWPDVMPESPAGAIDTYVSILRRRLSPSLKRARDCPYLLGSRSGYRLETSLFDLDVDRVETLVSEGRRQRERGDSAAALAAYTEAITLSRDPYLADEPDAHWALEPRQRFASMKSELLNAAAEAALISGDYAQALRLGEDNLASNRADEAAARLAILAAYALGRQAHALHIYEQTSASLRRDLGVRPSNATEQLQIQILRGEPFAKLLAAATAGWPTAPIDTGEIPFLGREVELARLRQAAGSAAQRGALLIVVEGEPGIGKSRLVEEFMLRSSTRFGAVKCSQLDRDLPFSALAGCLAVLIESLDEPGTEELMDAAPALAQLFPELPSEAPPVSLPPEAARIRLLDSVAAGLRILGPINLVIDDLHWCDDSTVQALGRVLQRAPDAPILLLASIRPGEAEANTSVTRLLDVASAKDRLHSIRLEPLPRSALDQLTSLGVDADEMWAATAGHPLFLAERLRAGRGDRLEESILIRVRAASWKARRVLEAASLFEGGFTADQLSRVVGETDEHLPDLVEQLVTARLLVEQGEELRFPHDLVRRCVYDQQLGARRQLLHRKAFQALTDHGAAPGELAHHAVAGRLFNAAIDNLNAAGELAVRQFANAEAAAHFGRAVAILEQRPGLAKPGQLGRLLVALARALTVLGRTDEAVTALERAQTIAAEDSDGIGELEATHWLARAHWAAWTPSRALPHALRALELAEHAADARLIGREHALAANPYGSLGQLEQSWRHVEDALRIYRDLGEDPPAEVLYRAGFMRHLQGDELRALRELAHAEVVAEKQHAETEIVFVRWVRAVALANLGRYSEAFLALASAQAASKGEEAVARSRIPNTYGSLYADLELWEEALDRDYESLEVTGTIGGAAVKEPRIQSLLNLAEDHLALGAPDKAARQLAEIERMMPGAEYGRFRYENRLHYVKSLMEYAREEWQPAVQFADACLSHAAIYGASKYEIRGRLARGRALWRLGQHQVGERELVAAAQRAEQVGFPTWARRSWMAAATAAAGSARSAGYLAKADAALGQIAGHLDVDLRDRFLAQASRPKGSWRAKPGTLRNRQL